jgi:hypothetical protein
VYKKSNVSHFATHVPCATWLLANPCLPGLGFLSTEKKALDSFLQLTGRPE